MRTFGDRYACKCRWRSSYLCEESSPKSHLIQKQNHLVRSVLQFQESRVSSSQQAAGICIIDTLPCKYEQMQHYLDQYCCCYYYYYTRLTASFPGQPGRAGTRKANQSGLKRGKRWWGFGMQWHQVDHMQKSAPRSRQITTPTCHHSIFTGQMLFLMSNHTHTHTRLMALFRDYPGEPLPER